MAHHADTAPQVPGEEVELGTKELFTLQSHEPLNIYVHCSPDDVGLLCWSTYANVSEDTLANWSCGWHQHLGSIYDEVDVRFPDREVVWWFPCFDGDTGFPSGHYNTEDYELDFD